MMIDEAIRHCLEVAENKEQAVYDLIAFGYSNSQEREDCQKCAEEHRQLAEWLKDYKRLLAKESGNLRCRTCVHFENDEAEECGRCFEYSAWEGEL